VQNENASVVKIRLEGLKSDVTKMANALKTNLCVVEESLDVPMRQRDFVHRYLVVLVKQDGR